MRLIGVSCATSVGSVQEKASRPSRVRTVSMSDRSSVIWTTLTVVILETRGSSGNVRPKASGGADEGADCPRESSEDQGEEHRRRAAGAKWEGGRRAAACS